MEELVASALPVRGVLIAPQLDGAQRGAALAATLADRNLEITRVTESEFRSAAETESPQGVLAIAEIPARTLDPLAGRESLRLLLLDAVQDPGNVGTILRTAEALAVDATIALPGTVDLWNAKVIRGAMGSIFRHHALHTSLDEFLRFSESNGIETWGADMSGVPVNDATPPAKLALAVGNEGAGLSSSLREHVSRFVSLPISGTVESLNVAVATGILLYQLRK